MKLLLVFRLTPAYAFQTLILSTLLWYAWDGPQFPHNQYRQLEKDCESKWWINLLYIGTLLPNRSRVSYD